jgi:Rrf2 family protein
VLKLTKKADYALMAMKHLAEHGADGSRSAGSRSAGSVSAKDVADAFGIPPEALAKILQRLAKAGLLHSQHGINGGYTLARAAHTISAFEVIQAIDGPLFITSCVTARGECGQTDRCNIREPLRKVNESIEAVLKRIKISHMREEPEEAASVAPKAAELVTIS